MKIYLMFGMIITMLFVIALELRDNNRRQADIMERVMDNQAMITSMYSQGRVGQAVK